MMPSQSCATISQFTFMRPHRSLARSISKPSSLPPGAGEVPRRVGALGRDLDGLPFLALGSRGADGEAGREQAEAECPE